MLNKFFAAALTAISTSGLLTLVLCVYDFLEIQMKMSFPRLSIISSSTRSIRFPSSSFQESSLIG